MLVVTVAFWIVRTYNVADFVAAVQSKFMNKSFSVNKIHICHLLLLSATHALCNVNTFTVTSNIHFLDNIKNL